MSPYYRRQQQRAVTLTAVLLVGAAIIGVWWLARYLGRDSINTQNNQNNQVTTNEPTDTGADPISTAKYAAISTTLGPIYIELYQDAAPKTVQNFVTLTRRGYYTNLNFHRIVKDFVAQGGDPNGDGSGGVSAFGETFEDEINADSLDIPADQKKMLEDVYGYKYRTDIKSHHMTAGAVAMANRGAKTNGSQFFIVTTKDQLYLDGRHTVFGQVVNQDDILTRLNAVETKSDTPVTPVTITKVVAGDTLAEVTAAVAQ
jgi:cyclophilin family peptidyl-prolyl cis-trans isomerase